MTTKTALDVPADPRWRHVIAATVLAAVRASSAALASDGSGKVGWGQGELGRMGDISLLLERALDDIATLPGVSSVTVDVESGPESVLVTVAGQGNDFERPPLHGSDPSADPLIGSIFEWSQTDVGCSFRVALVPR